MCSVIDSLADRFAAACEEHRIVGAQLAWNNLAGARENIEYGIANRGTGKPVTEQTRFQIGSVTKAMVALCVHQLARDGRANLDAPLSSIEWLAADTINPELSAITPRHLMAHTSGLQGDVFEDTGDDHEAAFRLAQKFAGEELLHKPGHDQSYCNFGYVLLGLWIEHWSNKPWHHRVDQCLKRFAGEHSLAFWPFPEPENLAAGHGPEGVWNRTHLALSNAAAGTSAVGTATDLALFGKTLLQLAQADDPIWQAMTTPLVKMARNERCIGFGEGLMVMDWDGQEVVGHDGLTIGQQAFVRVFPQTGISYGLVANGGDMTGLHVAVARLLAPMTGAALQHLALSPQESATSGLLSGTFDRRNASLEVTIGANEDGTLMVHHKEEWAREIYGSVEGPYSLMRVADDSWNVEFTGQSQPKMLTVTQDAAYYEMRRYNRVPTVEARS